VGRTHPQLQLPRPIAQNAKILNRIIEPTIQVSDKGLNYNLNIEVGSCLVLGRRLALLKDESLKVMPTDLVGHIYHEVNLEKPSTVTKKLDAWITTSLA
jgi:hypothetical protein